MPPCRAIIVGHLGQDGKLLTALLLSRGYGVLGLDRGAADALGPATCPGPCPIDDPAAVAQTVRLFQPDEVYFLAAHHNSSQAPQQQDLHREMLAGLTVNVAAPLHFLEALRLHAPAGRFFYAASSLIFGRHPIASPQDEDTPATPDEPYGFHKAMLRDACARFRSRYGLFASVGILYNHESVLRQPQFLSMKIVHAALAARQGATDKLTIGDLDATVDWGYAPDFVDAFTRILALDAPGDFIVATGQAHSVRAFLAAAYACVGLDWQRYVVTDGSVLSRRASGRVGNPAKLQRLTGWRPSVNFNQMIQTMIDQVAAGGADPRGSASRG